MAWIHQLSGSVVRACGLAVLSGYLKPCQVTSTPRKTNMSPEESMVGMVGSDAFPLEIVPKIRILGDTS